MMILLLVAPFIGEQVVFYHGKVAHPLRTYSQPGLPFVSIQDFSNALGFQYVESEEIISVWVNNRKVDIFPESGTIQLPWARNALQCKAENGVWHVRVDQLVSNFSQMVGRNMIYEATTRSIHLPREEALSLRLSLERKNNNYALRFFFNDHIEQPDIQKEGQTIIVRLEKPFVEIEDESLETNEVIQSYNLFQKLPDGSSEIHFKLSPLVVDHKVERYTTLNTSLSITLVGVFQFDTFEGPGNQEQAGTSVRSIVIDPGHGGIDEGARGPTGLKEKFVNLDISRKLERFLESHGDYEVTLTRNGDFHLPHKVRTGLANNLKADLFISIHVNAISRPDAWGGETYFLSLDESGSEDFTVAFENQEFGQDEPAESAVEDDPSLQLMLWDLAQNEHRDDSFRLARYIQTELNQLAGVRNRGVKQAPLKVLKGATMPAVLVEVAFISNPQEERNLKQTLFKQRLAQAIGRAVIQFDQDVQKRYAKLLDADKP